jgi:bifunctional DNA-binding transcriptional regulator/antitoxin component of YhaV-PrlF toxin-antitoxin module
MKTTLSSKGQLVLPAEFRELDGVLPGQIFEVERLDEGDYRLRRIAAAPNEGLVDWLLDCPDPGFLDSLPEFGSTDGVEPGFG